VRWLLVVGGDGGGLVVLLGFLLPALVPARSLVLGGDGVALSFGAVPLPGSCSSSVAFFLAATAGGVSICSASAAGFLF
jgi:hypothetical protein